MLAQIKNLGKMLWKVNISLVHNLENKELNNLLEIHLIIYVFLKFYILIIYEPFVYVCSLQAGTPIYTHKFLCALP